MEIRAHDEALVAALYPWGLIGGLLLIAAVFFVAVRVNYRYREQRRDHAVYCSDAHGIMRRKEVQPAHHLCTEWVCYDLPERGSCPKST